LIGGGAFRGISAISEYPDRIRSVKSHNKRHNRVLISRLRSTMDRVLPAQCNFEGRPFHKQLFLYRGRKIPISNYFTFRCGLRVQCFIASESHPFAFKGLVIFMRSLHCDWLARRWMVAAASAAERNKRWTNMPRGIPHNRWRIDPMTYSFVFCLIAAPILLLVSSTLRDHVLFWYAITPNPRQFLWLSNSQILTSSWRYRWKWLQRLWCWLTITPKR
jgi:hypothetical protein